MQSSDPTASPLTIHPPDRPIRFFIGGLQRHITQQDVERYLRCFGDFDQMTLKRDSSGHSRGYGWAVFRSHPAALVRPEPHILKGVVLTVEAAVSRGPMSASRAEQRTAPFPTDAPPRRRPRSSRSSSRSSRTSSSSSGPRRRSVRRESATRLPAIALGARLPPLPATSAAPQGEVYVCIPLPLCPQEFISDPRTFCARLDQNRIGGMQIVPAPFAQTNAGGQAMALVSNGGPPPPGPPPMTHMGMRR